MTAHIIFNKIDNKKYSYSFKKNELNLLEIK